MVSVVKKYIIRPCEGRVAMAGFVAHPNLRPSQTRKCLAKPRRGKISVTFWPRSEIRYNKTLRRFSSRCDSVRGHHLHH